MQPGFGLLRVTTDGVIDAGGLKPGLDQSLFCGNDFIRRGDFDAEVIDSAVFGSFEEHQLEWGIGDSEVGVTRTESGGLGAEQFGVERNGLFEVGDIEGQLESLGGRSFCHIDHGQYVTSILTDVNMKFVWHTGDVPQTNQIVAPSLPQLCCPGLDDPALTEDEADEIVVMLKALADPVRLRLMHLIARSGEACACDLPAALDRSQPTVSHHLKVLVEAGLLSREKRGKWAWFTVRHQQLQALSSVFQIDA